MNPDRFEHLAQTLRRLSTFCRRRGNSVNAERVEQLLEKLETQTFSLAASRSQAGRRLSPRWR